MTIESRLTAWDIHVRTCVANLHPGSPFHAMSTVMYRDPRLYIHVHVHVHACVEAGVCSG